MSKFTAIVLAAGKGVRMGSPLPKVLQDLNGKPLIHYVLREVVVLKKYISQIIVVVGYKGKEVQNYISGNFNGINCVYQENLNGTAGALKCTEPKVQNQNVLVICGDAPLITKKTLALFLSSSLKSKSPCSIVTAYIYERNDLGKVIRDTRGNICAIREQLDLGRGNSLNEINSGIYAFQKKILFKALKNVPRNKRKGEFYLTDVIEILYKSKNFIKSFILKESDEILGINIPLDLIRARKIMRMRVLEALAVKGVNIIDCDSTFIDEGVKVGQGTTIFPFTFIEKNAIIGSNCFLGPFIHIRGKTRIKDNTRIGNFTEINRSMVSCGVTMKHFGYLGDVTVGEGVNIGAGCVVANYDGKRKNKSSIEEGAFIGSDTVIVAPVKIGKGALTGAGSIVTKNVKPNTIVAGVPARPLKKRIITNIV
ncbi:MAG: NTP transferase domain-containing protein [Candidatus Omnitrophota bacterium]